MKEALRSSERRFLQMPHGLTSQKTPFFIVTAVKTTDLTNFSSGYLPPLSKTSGFAYPPKSQGMTPIGPESERLISTWLPYTHCSRKTNSVTLSPRANYTDWSTATYRRNLVSTFVDRGVSRGQRDGFLTVVNLSFLDRTVAARLSNVKGWSFPLLLPMQLQYTNFRDINPARFSSIVIVTYSIS
jgi:hypothetical protein